MTSLARAALVVMAALILVAGAGCGSDTKKNNNYVDAINKAQTDFANNVQNVGSSKSSSSSDPTQAAKDTFTKLNAAIVKVIGDLKAVTPPDKVKALHNQLVSEMTQFRDQVKAAGDSLDSKDPKTILSAQSKFASAASSLGTRISRTIDSINQKLQG